MSEKSRDQINQPSLSKDSKLKVTPKASPTVDDSRPSNTNLPQNLTSSLGHRIDTSVTSSQKSCEKISANHETAKEAKSPSYQPEAEFPPKRLLEMFIPRVETEEAEEIAEEDLGFDLAGEFECDDTDELIETIMKCNSPSSVNKSQIDDESLVQEFDETFLTAVNEGR